MATKKHVRIIGDTLTKLNMLVVLNGEPVDLSAYTVKWELEEDDGTVITAATSTGITSHPTQTFTADTTTNQIKCNSHGVELGQKIVVATSGTLPTGLSASTNYFATDITPDRFKLEEYPGAGAIDITGSGSGTHTFYVVGSVQYDFLSTEVDEAGLFRAWITLVSSSEIHTFPDDEYGIPIEIKAKGN
jgi:hypothetical protein